VSIPIATAPLERCSERASGDVQPAGGAAPGGIVRGASGALGIHVSRRYLGARYGHKTRGPSPLAEPVPACSSAVRLSRGRHRGGGTGRCRAAAVHYIL
jgi:hypothetical protein